jgi:hypothetical protein
MSLPTTWTNSTRLSLRPSPTEWANAFLPHDWPPGTHLPASTSILPLEERRDAKLHPLSPRLHSAAHRKGPTVEDSARLPQPVMSRPAVRKSGKRKQSDWRRRKRTRKLGSSAMRRRMSLHGAARRTQGACSPTVDEWRARPPAHLRQVGGAAPFSPLTPSPPRRYGETEGGGDRRSPRPLCS